MSALLAPATPRRIKATHRRRGKVASGRFVQRYYDAEIGRFISPDPVGPEEDFIKHFNRYNYALNNPVRYTDPDGRYFCNGSRAACVKVDAYVKQINVALKNLKPGSDDYNKVAKVAKNLGVNDGRGTKINTVSLPPGTQGKGGVNTNEIKIDVKQIEDGANATEIGAGAIAHEIRHNLDTIDKKSPAMNVQQVRNREINAYATERAVLQGSNISSSLDTKDGFDRAVQDSVDGWVGNDDP